MKIRMIAPIAALLVLAGAQNAFANRAEELVFGTGDGGYLVSGGSLYFDENYNMFYNPVYVNDYKNWGILEKFNGFGAVEGGFVASISNFNFGLYLDRTQALTIPGSASQLLYGSAANMRPIEAFFGGDMGGAKVGVGLSYGSAAIAPTPVTAAYSESDLTLRLGADIAGLAPFASYRVISNALAPAPNQASFHDLTLGARYKFGEWTPFAVFRNVGAVDQSGVSSNYYQAAGVGIGRQARIAQGVGLMYSLSGVRVFNSNTGTGLVDTGRTIIPLDLGVQADLVSWLTLMGGLQYNVMDKSGDTTNPDSSRVRLGAKIRIAKAELDWVVGGGSGGPGNPDSQYFDFSNGFFSDASLTYRW